MAFRWRADDGPTLNAGLIAPGFVRGPGPVFLRNPIFCDFQGVCGPDPCPTPSGSAHSQDIDTHMTVIVRLKLSKQFSIPQQDTCKTRNDDKNYIRRQKLNTTYFFFFFFCWNNFRTSVKKFYLTWKSFIVLWSSTLVFKWKSKNTCNIRILLQNHEFSWLIKASCYRPEIFKELPPTSPTNFVPFSSKFLNIYSWTQSCNENKMTNMCFLLNSPFIIWQNSMTVSLSYSYMMHLYLCIRFIYITEPASGKK